MTKTTKTSILTLLAVGRAPEIPRPTPRDPQDSDPANYTPEAMTDDQRIALRKAGIAVSNLLGSMSGPAALSKLNPAAEAGENMKHYRHGNGRSRSYNAAKTEEILAQGTVSTPTPMALDDVTQTFVAQIIAIVSASGPGTYQYLANNFASDNDAIRGTHWFPMYSADSKWKYALGGFDFAPAALAINDGVTVTVKYRIFIWDRYNWDEGKTVQLPYFDPEIAIGPEAMGNLLGAQPRQGTPNPYISDGYNYKKNEAGEWIKGTRYTSLNDALFGNLINEDLAQNYDINGAGQIHTYRVNLSEVDIPAAIGGQIPKTATHSVGTGE